MAQPIGSGGAALAVARQQRAREKFAILLLVEPGAFDIEQLEAGDELGECERVDGELRDELSPNFGDGLRVQAATVRD